MGNFSIPVKQIIVNSDSQVDVIDGLTGINDATGPFGISGFFNNLDASQLDVLPEGSIKVREVPAVAATAEDADFTFTLGAAAGDVVIVRENSLDLTPTEFQNQDVDKRYQLPVCADAVATAVAAAAAINADPYAKVVATAPGAGVLTLVAKETGSEFAVYTGESNVTLLEPVAPVKDPDVVAVLGTGNYDTLKNINFSKNIEEDRNQEYFPKKGSTYTQHYFEVNWTTVDLGGQRVPSALAAAGKTAFQIWSVVGSATEIALKALTVKLNPL